jgi:hypothetical protein
MEASAFDSSFSQQWLRFSLCAPASKTPERENRVIFGRWFRIQNAAFQLLHEGWRGARTPFLAAIVLDCIYQIATVQFVYPLELLFTATLLALVPYALLRGPFNRIARLLLNSSARG